MFTIGYDCSDVLKAVASKDATGKLFKYDPSKKVVTVLLELRSKRLSWLCRQLRWFVRAGWSVHQE